MINDTPLKAIRLKCLDCSAGQTKEAKLCPVEKCSLWPFRLGHRPKDDTKPKRKANPAAIEAMRTAREAKARKRTAEV